MTIRNIPLIAVSYNSAELVSDLLTTFRKYYDNPVYLIDGSEASRYADIEKVVSAFHGVQCIHFEHNIHHGPGMAWAIENLPLAGRVLFLDSDIYVLYRGFLESLDSVLQPGMYGVGRINHVNEEGFDVEYTEGAIPYLHPACMLCNVEVMRQWPMPTRHGAPMIEPMKAIQTSKATQLLGHVPWLENDFRPESQKIFLRHDWRGTVLRSGTYHLDEWMGNAKELAAFQRGVLGCVPPAAKRVVHLSSGSGGLLRAYKQTYPDSHCTGVYADRLACSLAESSCDVLVEVADVAALASVDLDALGAADCWILEDLLECIADPWDFLRRLRKVMPATATVVAYVPNVQHWMMLAKLAIGDFRYAQVELLRKSQLRFFSRLTLLETFQECGFRITGGFPRIHPGIDNEAFVQVAAQLAALAGGNAGTAAQDARAIGIVVSAMPGA
ncbi:type 12 methyltransferase [Candidatus Symbiobacter mobilis]|uniref:Type 12 methyltransferase n=1 Tax=Candidatus Symbiobacter mobilis CR TaxID=946483 RepID=U5NEP8_9BURK|nr:type 12 methyltransferase [Candidatus Symbiobacter mobilis]AGX88708.1 type 12 methyltransferase [Candidatus Symbiobacter mobilis CR]